MLISIASGKGGTGKTTVAVSLAAAIPNSTYIDCDVEEPNGHLFLKPAIKEEKSVFKLLPSIDNGRCDQCGKCTEVCEFNALINLKSEIMLIKELCHSCGSCVYFCPSNAITETKIEIGRLRFGYSENDISFIDGILNIGEISAVPLINSIKENINSENVNIIDSPPGTSCSMVETVKDSDYCILVTESTPFGLNDLKLAIDVISKLAIPFGVIINKYDKTFIEMDSYLDSRGIDILGKIPFDKKLAELYSRGNIPLVNSEELRTVYRKIIEQISGNIERKLVNER